MQLKYRTFDGQEVEDGWYTAQYKTEREVVYVLNGKLYTGPWFSDWDGFQMLEDTSGKHHDFIRLAPINTTVEF